MKRTEPPPEVMPHIPALDGFRGMAIAFVLVLHVSYGKFSGGILGMDLFFALSGFLINSILLYEYQAHRRLNYGQFYLRRILRLYPALLTVIVIGLGYHFWMEPDADYNIGKTSLAVLFFLGNIFPNDPHHVTWSLAVEEHFYIVWPLTLSLLLRHAPWRRIVALLSLTALGAMLLRWAMRDGWLASVIEFQFYTSTPTRFDAILIGCIASFAWFYALRDLPIARPGFWRSLSNGLLIAFVLLGLLVNYARDAAFIDRWGFTTGTLLAVSWLLSIVQESGKPSICRRLLESPPMIWLGKRSYGIYLYHWFFIWGTESWREAASPVNFLWVSALRLALTFGFAELSYRVIERPALRLKNRLYRPASSPPPIQSPA